MARPGTLLLAGLMALGLGACGSGEAPRTAAPPQRAVQPPEPAPAAPSLVLLVLCSTRYDHLGFAGYGRDTSPFLDSLAARGTVFRNAMSASTWTKPSTATLLTGLTPNVHGLTEYYTAGAIEARGFEPRRTLSDDVVTLAEALSAGGYATFARSNNVHASRSFNLMQGFSDAGPRVSNAETPELLAEFGRWLAKVHPTQPFFFFLLTRDAHITYRPDYEIYQRFAVSPVPRREYDGLPARLKKLLDGARSSGAHVSREQMQQWIDLYDAELAQLDAALSGLPGILERAGRGGSTVVVVTADHGEFFFDPGGVFSHGGPVFDEPLVHIPLLFHGPGVPARGVEDVVRSIDIYPTLTELAGVDTPDVVQGRSLLPLIRGEALPPLSAFASFEPREEAGRPSAAKAHAVRQGRHKLQQRPDGTLLLYDLERDPGEREDRLADDPKTVLTLRGELDSWLAEERSLAALVARGEARELSPEVLEQLRELGYVEGLEEE